MPNHSSDERIPNNVAEEILNFLTKYIIQFQVSNV